MVITSLSTVFQSYQDGRRMITLNKSINGLKFNPCDKKHGVPNVCQNRRSHRTQRLIANCQFPPQLPPFLRAVKNTFGHTFGHLTKKSRYLKVDFFCKNHQILFLLLNVPQVRINLWYNQLIISCINTGATRY